MSRKRWEEFWNVCYGGDMPWRAIDKEHYERWLLVYWEPDTFTGIPVSSVNTSPVSSNIGQAPAQLPTMSELASHIKGMWVSPTGVCYFEHKLPNEHSSRVIKLRLYSQGTMVEAELIGTTKCNPIKWGYNVLAVSSFSPLIVDKLDKAVPMGMTISDWKNDILPAILAVHNKVDMRSSPINLAPSRKPTAPSDNLPDYLKGATMISSDEVIFEGRTYFRDNINVWRDSVTLIEAEIYIQTRRALG